MNLPIEAVVKIQFESGPSALIGQCAKKSQNVKQKRQKRILFNQVENLPRRSHPLVVILW